MNDIESTEKLPGAPCAEVKVGRKWVEEEWLAAAALASALAPVPQPASASAPIASAQGSERLAALSENLIIFISSCLEKRCSNPLSVCCIRL